MADQCSIEAGKIIFCEGIDSVIELQGRGTRSQGVKTASMIDATTFRFSRNLVIIKSGKHGKRGVIANFCPFCGENIVPKPQADLVEGNE